MQFMYIYIYIYKAAKKNLEFDNLGNNLVCDKLLKNKQIF